MFVRNRIDNGVIDTVKLAAVLSVAGPVIGQADYKSAASSLLPALKKTAQLPVRIPKRSLMTLIAVFPGAFQIEIIGIVDGIHIQIEENLSVRIGAVNFFHQKIYLIFRTVLHRTGKGRIPPAFLKISRKYFPNR